MYTHKTQRSILILCLSFLLIGGLNGVASAGPLYSETMSFFSEGLDVQTGTTYHDPTILVLVCGPEDQVEFVLKPNIADLADFTFSPKVDLHFGYHPEALNELLVGSESSFEMAVVDHAFDFDGFDALTFLKIEPETTLQVNFEHILVFKTEFNYLVTMALAQNPAFGVDVLVEEFQPVPEPTSILLLGSGVLALCGWMRRRRNSAKHLLTVMLAALAVVATVPPALAQESLITIRKSGTGSGTVLAGEVRCEAWCPEVQVPYSRHTAIVLKVVPEPDSVFVRWEKADGSASTGKLNIQPGDIVTAVFDKRTNQETLPYVEKHVLVKLRQDAVGIGVETLHEQLGVVKIEPLDMIGAEIWDISIPVTDALQQLEGSVLIDYVEPDYIVTLDQRRPNDPNFAKLWGLHNTGQFSGNADADIDAPEAWNISTGANVVVAVIDTGVDYRHPDLAANMWKNVREIPNNGKDDDGNGYVDDVYGYDFANNDGDPFDDHAHGTHCAGTIAGVGNNGQGVSGVNWSAKIMALKFLDRNGSGRTSDAVKAVQYATRMGVKITSNSWGGGGYSRTLYDAIRAAGNAGSLFIAAAGNSNRNIDSSPHYPSSYNLNNIISVAATDYRDNRSNFSNYGKVSVDLGAPGSHIYSTMPNNGYDYKSGTSMATPYVSGVAALVWAACSQVTAPQVKQAILANVDPLSSLHNRTVTGGRLNAFKAVKSCPAPPPTTKPLYRLRVGGMAGGEPWSNHMDSKSSGESGFPCQRRLGYMLETPVSGTKPLYRKARTHNGSGNDIKDDHMTTDDVNQGGADGWKSEGILGYIYTTQVPGTIPLYQKYWSYRYPTWELGWYWHRDYITTTDRNEGNGSGWVFVKTLGYIVRPASSSCP